MEECFFCGSKDIILFNEHYTFCKNCTAIYTIMSTGETVCEHFINKDEMVVVERLPWFEKFRNISEPYVFDTKTAYGSICSTCGKEVCDSGW